MKNLECGGGGGGVNCALLLFVWKFVGKWAIKQNPSRLN